MIYSIILVRQLWNHNALYYTNQTVMKPWCAALHKSEGGLYHLWDVIWYYFRHWDLRFMCFRLWYVRLLYKLRCEMILTEPLRFKKSFVEGWYMRSIIIIWDVRGVHLLWDNKTIKIYDCITRCTVQMNKIFIQYNSQI